MIALPIDPHLGSVIGALKASGSVVLKASPGSGKTTRVPPALLKSGLLAPGSQILVLEPRRLAAKLAARRVSEEMGTQVGAEVGYQFRFESQSSERTRILFLTEGLLMRKLISDPLLKRASVVILDEFHERHLQGDVALAFLRQLQRTRRPDLKLVVMSATLEVGPLAQYLGGAPVLTVEAPVFPLEVRHARAPIARTLETEVRLAVEELLRGDSGDILVFLPGMREILRAADTLRQAQTGAEILPLHGELSREEQEKALSPGTRRKIILSTNVAETSLTIPGVRSVVDSGLARQASYSWWSGVPALRTRPISKASAIQRAGRAARTAPGVAVRLYTQGEFEGRAAFDTPEIRRADLAQTALELKSLGIRDLFGFEWFESPARQSLEQSVELLLRLDAIDETGEITADGRAMAVFPAHPRIARLMLEAGRRGHSREGAILAAMISEGELESPDALSDLRRGERDLALKRVWSRLEELAPPKERTGEGMEKALCKSLLAAFPDRVAWRKSTHAKDVLLSSGGSARLIEGALYPSEAFWVALDVRERQAGAHSKAVVDLRSAIGIEEGWLFDLKHTALAESKELAWDSERKKLTAMSRLSYGALVLSESADSPEGADAGELLRMLLKGARGIDLGGRQAIEENEFVSIVGEEASMLLRRLKLAAETFPELGIPRLDGAALFGLLKTVLGGKISASALDETRWEDELLAAIQKIAPDFQAHQLEKWFPSHYPLRPGRRTKVHYEASQPPWIESRLQDFFGLKQGPSIARGRIKLTLHLLAPNQRAVQVTSDLEGFWARTYREVRAQLMRRYPRHSWPEDPLTASPPEDRRRQPQ